MKTAHKRSVAGMRIMPCRSSRACLGDRHTAPPAIACFIVPRMKLKNLDCLLWPLGRMGNVNNEPLLWSLPLTEPPVVLGDGRRREVGCYGMADQTGSRRWRCGTVYGMH